MKNTIPPHFIEVSPGHWTHPSNIQGAPKVYGASLVVAKAPDAKPPKRIRQSTKPLLNKLEQEYLGQLRIADPDKTLFAQAVTFRLANGVRYTPDIFCFSWWWHGMCVPMAWEVKGPWMTDDAVVKLKVFAATYPGIRVLLASKNKESGMWLAQEVHP